MSYKQLTNFVYEPRIHQRSSISYYQYKIKKTILSRIKQFKKLRQDNIQFKYFTNCLLILCLTFFCAVLPLLMIKKYVRQLETIVTILMNGIMWGLLGVLSTIGLGAGLHTFVLFLGPYIIKVVLTANECESTHFNTGVHWLSWDDGVFNILSYPDSAFTCLQPSYTLTVWSVLKLVLYPTLCWGIGSALGEMPPYFIAKASRMNGEDMEELKELQTAHQHLSIIQKAKLFVINNVSHVGFTAIFLLAAIPNPLFDLAGLACGYLGIPFNIFLSATVSAKGFVKAPVQALFYVVFFSASFLDYLLQLVHTYLPILEPYVLKVLNQISKQATNQCTNNSNVYDDNILNIKSTIEKCLECCDTSMKTSKIHNKCYERCNNIIETKSSLLSIIWNIIIALAFIYFIISTVYTLYSSRKIYKRKNQQSETKLSTENDSQNKLSV